MKNNSAKGFGIASLILGSAGLICLALFALVRMSDLWSSFGCIAFSIAGIVFGAVSIKKQTGRNICGLIGLIMSSVTLVFFILIWLLIISLFIFFSDFINWISGIGAMG